MAERQVWERQDGETPRAYDAFRRFRDAGPRRAVEPIADAAEVSLNTAKRWSARHLWHTRAEAWDDHCHRIEDEGRLDKLRKMHADHVKAGQIAILKAMQALAGMPANQIPAGAAARLLELGVRIERNTLTVTPEDLLGQIDGEAEVDPWDAIADALVN